MVKYLTSGQVARRMRISVSTLKRWLADRELEITECRNYNGWRPFTEEDIEILRKHRRQAKRNGKRFAETTLIPVIISPRSQTAGK